MNKNIHSIMDTDSGSGRDRVIVNTVSIVNTGSNRNGSTWNDTNFEYAHLRESFVTEIPHKGCLTCTITTEASG